jgi:DNA-binding response OmpR family regulator
VGLPGTIETMTRSTVSSLTDSTRTYGTASIMLYSDSAEVRRDVRLALGEGIGQPETSLTFTEVATPDWAMHLAETERYDLIIMDNETAKLGGVGLTRQMRLELDWQPTVLLLLARQQDAWLGAWSGADAALPLPIDPFELHAKVAELLGTTDE